VRRAAPGDRLARLTTVFTFVSHLVDVPPPVAREARDGVDVLIALAGEEEGPALILAALLQALGERAALAEAAGFAFVRVEIGLADLRRLPPHARPLARRGRCYLPLDPRGARRPLGFLPAPVWHALPQGPGYS
jgi:hypothetical protein